MEGKKREDGLDILNRSPAREVPCPRLFKKNAFAPRVADPSVLFGIIANGGRNRKS